MKYEVKNYRYGLAIGTILAEEDVDETKMKYLEAIKEKKKPKKSTKKVEEEE